VPSEQVAPSGEQAEPGASGSERASYGRRPRLEANAAPPSPRRSAHILS